MLQGFVGLTSPMTVNPCLVLVGGPCTPPPPTLFLGPGRNQSFAVRMQGSRSRPKGKANPGKLQASN